MRRRQWLLQQELAEERAGAVAYRPDTISLLQRREVQRLATQLSGELGMPVREATTGTTLDGIVRKPINGVSGRFALIERSHDFVLVPWRPALDRQIGKVVSGIVRPSGVSWSIGRGRGGPSIS